MEFIPSLFLPRGIRNNNPGNLRLGTKLWIGQRREQADTSFAEFETPFYGLRALMRILTVYAIKYGLDDIQSVINRFAPPHENATDAYVYSVCRHLKKGRNDKINLLEKDILIPFAEAIVLHENGRPFQGAPGFWYPPDYYALAYDLVIPRKNNRRL